MTGTRRSMADEWAFLPDVPTKPAPYFAWPPRPVDSVKYAIRNHLWVNDRTFYILLALVVGLWLQPVDDEQQDLAAGWVAEVLVRNYVAVLIIVGGLHWWFYVRNGQGGTLRYDDRALGRNKRIFFTGDQVRDNVFYTLAYGVPIASSWEIWARWMYAGDRASTVTFDANPTWFVLGFLAMPIWQSLHFYVIHRAIHHESIYSRVHAVHHRNVNIGPWSGLAMHPVEHLLYFSTLALVLLVPTHPSHILFLLYWQMLGAPSGHAGYDAVVVGDRPVLQLNSFFHQLHHRYQRCNYGSAEFPLDYWLGTLHDGTDEGAARLRQRHR